MSQLQPSYSLLLTPVRIHQNEAKQATSPYGDMA